MEWNCCVGDLTRQLSVAQFGKHYTPFPHEQPPPVCDIPVLSVIFPSHHCGILLDWFGLCCVARGAEGGELCVKHSAALPAHSQVQEDGSCLLQHDECARGSHSARVRGEEHPLLALQRRCCRPGRKDRCCWFIYLFIVLCCFCFFFEGSTRHDPISNTIQYNTIGRGAPAVMSKLGALGAKLEGQFGGPAAGVHYWIGLDWIF